MKVKVVNTWSSSDLRLALVPKLVVAACFLWVSLYIPSPFPLLLFAAAAGVLASAGTRSIFATASGLGVPGWLFAIILAPTLGDEGLPLVPGIALLIVVLIASRQVLLTLMTPRSAHTRESNKTHALNIVKAAASVAVVGLALLPVLGMFGPPSLDNGPIFGGQGDGAQPYWGFNQQMDTGNRGELGDEVVMRVRADKPSFWRGQSFDVWDGRFWHRSDFNSSVVQSDEAGFTIFSTGSDPSAPTGEVLTQTFTLEKDGSDIVFGAPDMLSIAHPVEWFNVYTDGSVRAPIDLAEGSQYTVVSERPFVTPELLRAADPLEREVPGAIRDRYLDARTTDRVAALAEEITADATNAYDKIIALETWMANNISYDLDIPPLPNGADAVEQLLFVDKIGFCEQIGTALAVMARSVGIPARLAVGYVPNDFDRFRGSWTVRGRDAHAWTEVYFPGVGWQGFDPTAEVPLSGARPEVGELSTSMPSWPVLIAAVLLAAALVGVGFGTVHLLKRRQMTWEARLAERLERLGADAGRKRRPGEGIGRYADILGKRSGRDELVALGVLLNRANFSPEGLDDAGRRTAEDLLSSLEQR